MLYFQDAIVFTLRSIRQKPSLSELTMVQAITLKKIGGSVGAILPKDMLDRQHLQADDQVFVVETPQGILLTAVDPATTEALAAYAILAKENRAAMAALAKL